MMGNKAWQRHGCYRLGSDQYFNMPLQTSSVGCMDDWNSLDHFDPTADSRRLFRRFTDLRSRYVKLQDGFGVNALGNWTYFIQLPGSNGTGTEMGLWAASRTSLAGQTLDETSPDVMLLWMNDNTTKPYPIKCKDATALKAPWPSGTTIKNLFSPYEEYTLIDGPTTGGAGCLSSITLDPYGFKAFVPIGNFTPPRPEITHFSPGHDARLYAEVGDANATSIDISFEFNTQMDCDSVTNSITLNMSSSGHGGKPTLGKPSFCGPITADYHNSTIIGVDPSLFRWSASVSNVPDGILTISVTNATNQGKNASTNVCPHLMSAQAVS
jgi:alpha-1,3-glucan synthase